MHTVITCKAFLNFVILHLILHQFAVVFSFFIHILLPFIATDCQYALQQKYGSCHPILMLVEHAKQKIQGHKNIAWRHC